MNIASWPQQERPQEKLLSQGPQSLSDAELLAIVLHSGKKGLNAIDLARQLLVEFNGLRRLLVAPPQDLLSVSGLGPSKYARLAVVKELGNRCRLESLKEKDVLNGASRTKEYLKAKYQDRDSEVFCCLFLDSQHQLIRLEELFTGTIDGAAVYPREVVKKCLEVGSAAVIFAHNHPSGVAEPSQADIAITAKLKAALSTIDVRVLDHLIIGDPNVTSLAERGLM
ncbi:MAG: DNA repair protein RadC [Pseudohongiellaceae bacterium]